MQQNERTFELVSKQFKQSFIERVEKAKQGYPFSKKQLKAELDSAKINSYINNTEYTEFVKMLLPIK